MQPLTGVGRHKKRLERLQALSVNQIIQAIGVINFLLACLFDIFIILYLIDAKYYLTILQL
jgi:hypothetical protein